MNSDICASGTLKLDWYAYVSFYECLYDCVYEVDFSLRTHQKLKDLMNSTGIKYLFTDEIDKNVIRNCKKRQNCHF